VLAFPSLAAAVESGPAKPAAEQSVPWIGLSPGEPQVRSATPAIPFGVSPAESKAFVLDFHGYLLLPAQLGMHEREMPMPGQSATVLHAPPVMAQDLRSFEYTGAVPASWVQLNFTYGNSTVAATTILAARALSDAAGYYNPVDQLGVNDAYLTVNLTKHIGFPFQLHVGAYTGRYGAMGTYDAGRYATPLIVRTNTIGETITTGHKLGDFFVVLEQGLGGQLARPPAGLVPAGWNDFADDGVGATFVNQVHLGVAYRDIARLGLHYVTAWTQDDLTNGGEVPDGRITVLGVDLAVNAGPTGHLYVGATQTKATNASTVSGAIEILNARGGPELKEHYLGVNSNGNGSLTTIGGQYDISVAKAIFGPWYTGVSPDILISLFGVATKVSSRDPDQDGVRKIKGGAEITYLPLSWFGVSERFDHVRLRGGDSRQAISISSSRLLFHTGWRSRDEIALQYSYFSYGSDVHPKLGYPPTIDPNANPDRHVFSLYATFWW
jgi:hypothetical protein